MELREGKLRRREAKRKLLGQTEKIPTKKLRWGEGGKGLTIHVLCVCAIVLAQI